MMFLNMSGKMPRQIASGYQKTKTTPEAIRHMQSQTSAIVVMMLSFMDYYDLHLLCSRVGCDI